MMRNKAISEYFDALDRLRRGVPIRVPQGTAINNDSVALEAGRMKGSIKRSRETFAELIVAIDMACPDLPRKRERRERLESAERFADEVVRQLDASIGRELSLLMQVYQLKKELASLTGKNVLPIRARVGPVGSGA
jgi:hypothetical protein